MTTFLELSENAQAFFAGLWSLALLGAVTAVVLAVQFGRSIWRVAVQFVFAVVVYGYLNILLKIVDKSEDGMVAVTDGYGLWGTYPMVAWETGLMGICLAVSYSIWEMIRSRRKNPSVVSVKESLDDLPAGVCYYEDNGRILLANRAMNVLSAKLNGQTMLSGRLFWEQVLAKRNIDTAAPELRKEGEETVLIRFADDSVVSFTSRIREIEGKSVHEVHAVDVTEEYRVSEELAGNNRKLLRQLDQYRDLAKVIEKLIIEREILQAKTKLHDDVGATLVATRRYLEGATEKNGDSIFERWRQNVILLRGQTNPESIDGYGSVLTAGEDVGIHVDIDGKLPEREPGSQVMRCAIHECITNTIRHADGDTLHISCRKNGDIWEASLWNNGIPPKGPIRETGGLHDLRIMTEAAGGTMETSTEPVFLLKLTIPELREAETMEE